MVDTATSLMEPALRSGGEGGTVAAAVRAGVARRGLLARLTEAARVTVLSAPAGSGKTVLLRSWVGEAGLSGRSVGARCSGRSVIRSGSGSRWPRAAGYGTGSPLVRPVTAAPDLDGWAIVEWLLKDLAALEDRIWLVIDDVHELRSAEARPSWSCWCMRAPHGAAVRPGHPA